MKDKKTETKMLMKILLKRALSFFLGKKKAFGERKKAEIFLKEMKLKRKLELKKKIKNLKTPTRKLKIKIIFKKKILTTK